MFSSKVPDLQFLTPQLRSLLKAVGCRFLSLMGMEDPLPPFNECLVLIPALPSVLMCLGKSSAPTLLHFPEGLLLHFHLGGGGFSQAQIKGQELIPRQWYPQWDLESKVRCLKAGIYM